MNLLKRGKPRAKQRKENIWVKPWLKNRANSSAYNNLYAEKQKIFPNYSFFLNTCILCMNFLQTNFIRLAFHS